MSIQFPASPSENDTFVASNGVSYTFKNGGWYANDQAGLDDRYVNVDGDQMTGDLTVPSLNGNQLAGFRNQLINGGMDVWQRATSYNTTSSDAWLYRTVDRWSLGGSQTDEGETKQVTSTAGSLTGMPKGFAYAFAYWDKTDTSTRSSMSQAIELPVSGGNCRGAGPFTPGSQWTLSCYCSADITSITPRMDFSDSIQNVNAVSFGAAANWVEIEAPTSTRWGRYAVTFTGSSNNFNTTTRCMRVVLGAIGKQPTPADFTSVSSRVGITGVQLEPGPVATPFEHRPIGTELELCQRYYYYTGSNYNMSMYKSGTGRIGYVFLPTIMRDTPTVTQNDSQYISSLSLSPYPNVIVLSGNITDDSRGGYVGQISADAEL